MTSTVEKPGPFTLWVCEPEGHTWWALRPETQCPDCGTEEIAAFEDYPEQPRCSVCHRDWRIAPVVGNTMCAVCREGYVGD